MGKTSEQQKVNDEFKACFYDLVPNSDEGLWKCKLCAVDAKPKTQAKFTGCQNLKSHINTAHAATKDAHLIRWRQAMARKDGMTMEDYMVPTVSVKALNVYGWLDLMIGTNQPCNFVENRTMRLYVKGNLTEICTKSLMKYMKLVANEVNTIIKEALPPSFGVIFDGITTNNIYCNGLSL